MGAESPTQTVPVRFRSIPFGPRRAIVALLLAAMVYAFFLGLAFLLEHAGSQNAYALAVIHAGGFASLLVFWMFGRWGKARFDSFGGALLLVGAAFRVQALIDALVYGDRIDSIARHRNVPLPEPVISLLLKGEAVTVIGLLLVACSWRLSVGSSVERHSFLNSRHAIPGRTAWLVYVGAVAVDVLRRVVGVSFGPLDQVTSLLFVAGIASVYFLASSRRGAVRQVVSSVVLATPLCLLALDSGMKEEIFFPLVPAAILYWLRFRHFSTRAAALVAAVFLLSLSQLYVHHVREVSWRSSGDLDIPTGDLVRSFAQGLGSADPLDALDHMSSRINMTGAHAITVSLADNYGYEPIDVFGLIPAGVVPRLLWPGKPVMQPGAMHTARILGTTESLSEIRSATAAGFSTELYLGGWWLGVVFGALAYGWLLGTSQMWSLRFADGFGHQALCFIALYWTFRFDEKHVVYAYTSIVFAAVFIWMLSKATRVLGFSSLEKAQLQGGDGHGSR